jgi:hypothetical protein
VLLLVLGTLLLLLRSLYAFCMLLMHPHAAFAGSRGNGLLPWGGESHSLLLLHYAWFWASWEVRLH